MQLRNIFSIYRIEMLFLKGSLCKDGERVLNGVTVVDEHKELP